MLTLTAEMQKAAQTDISDQMAAREELQKVDIAVESRENKYKVMTIVVLSNKKDRIKHLNAYKTVVVTGDINIGLSRY